MGSNIKLLIAPNMIFWINEVVSVIKYRDPKELLKQEGLEVLSSLVANIDDGIELLYNFHEYKEMIPVHGIFAIHIQPVT